MPVPMITSLIPVAMKLVMDLITMAREAGQMSKQEFEDIKKKLDDEFDNFPEWGDL